MFQDFSHVADHLGSMSMNDKQPKNPRKSRSVNLNFPSKQVQSNACVMEYQDGKLSPVVLKGNPTYGKWRTRSSQARDEAKRRYKKKKKNRKYVSNYLQMEVKFPRCNSACYLTFGKRVHVSELFLYLSSKTVNSFHHVCDAGMGKNR